MRMATRAMIVALVATALPGWGVAARAALAQQPVSIVGRVVDGDTGDPVTSAEVRIPFAGIHLLTTDLGWFLVPNAPPGEYVLEVARAGYRTETRTILVGEEPLSLEFRLPPQPLELGSVDVVRDREADLRSTSREVLDLSEESVSGGNGLDLLRRVVGAEVIRGSGEPGSGAAVRLRGSTSIGRARDPLVIVDGAPTSLGALADIKAFDIARIEVLKGAAAAAEYGSQGQAGVILVTTKRGLRKPR
jgi:TonB-dependent SusC/RagA subfamily outer membrane receptor